MSENHYDHDQDERDYYDRESEKQLRSCLFSLKALAVITVLFIIGMLIFSCKSAEPPVALPYGPVISVQGDKIEVAFEVINKEPGSQISGWFYVPGHGFVKGNIFPDFSKYRHPLPEHHGNR